MTVGVYGLVAAIVKIDDAGLYLNGKSGVQRSLGKLLLLGAPLLMKTLSVAGTAAMFLVKPVCCRRDVIKDRRA